MRLPLQHRFLLAAAVAALATVAAVPPAPSSPPAPGSAAAAVASNLEVVGHEPLLSRGMNAALAVHGDHAYVGSRTDGKPGNVNDAGVLVVDVSDPATPQVVHQIGPPDQGNEGETSRELRVWPQQELLIVQNLGSNCSYLIHACSPRAVDDHFAFYDVSGDKAAAPELVARYRPSADPHEFYLWVDPADGDRALLFISATASNQLLVTDISGAREGVFEELVDFPVPAPGGDLHSMTPTADGTETSLAYLTGGYLVADTSDVVDGDPGAEIELVTGRGDAPTWPGPGAHSALRIPGSDVALVTDEVYGEALRALGGHGCPWGWTRFVDISDPSVPVVVGEYRLAQNQPDFCTTDAPRPFSSYSAHNPTVTDELAFISWHAGGLQVVAFDDPTVPTQAAEFVPDPLPYVLQEDPALTAGQDKVAMWSFPIIKDGLVYVVDLRNGLYVLRYTGPGADEVASIRFLEGNSNLGDALRYDPID